MSEPQTVRERMIAAGISEERFFEHLAAGRVLVDGQVVTDPDTPAATPASVGLGLGSA